MKVLDKQRNSKMCFICGMENPAGFKSQFYNMEDYSVITPVTFNEVHQSFSQKVHGGLIATMLDELACRAYWAQGNLKSHEAGHFCQYKELLVEQFVVNLRPLKNIQSLVPFFHRLIWRQYQKCHHF